MLILTSKVSIDLTAFKDLTVSRVLAASTVSIQVSMVFNVLAVLKVLKVSRVLTVFTALATRADTVLLNTNQGILEVTLHPTAATVDTLQEDTANAATAPANPDHPQATVLQKRHPDMVTIADAVTKAHTLAHTNPPADTVTKVTIVATVSRAKALAMVRDLNLLTHLVKLDLTLDSTIKETSGD